MALLSQLQHSLKYCHILSCGTRTNGSATVARLGNNIVTYPSSTMDFNVATIVSELHKIVA